MAINYKEEIKKCLNDYKNLKTVYKQIPNLLTVIRAIGIIPVNILLFTGNIVPALIVIAIMFLSDCFDGKIARKYDIVSEFGAKLDAVCDKLMVIGLVIPLISGNLMLIINFIFEILIGGVNTLNEKKGYEPKTVLSGKIKTWLLFATLGIGYLSLILKVPTSLFNSLILGTGMLQMVTFLEYVKFYKDRSKEIKNQVVNEDITLDECEFENDNSLVRNREIRNEYNDVKVMSKVKKRVRKKCNER